MKKYYILLLLALCWFINLKAQNPLQSDNTTGQNYSKYYDSPPQFLTYPGGFFQYLTENIVCPKGLQQNVSGQINIHCIVDSTGTISDIKIIRSVSKEVDDAVLNAIAKAPKWQPAILKGKSVSTFFAIVMDIIVNSYEGKIIAKRNVGAQVKEMQLSKRIFDTAPVFPDGNNFFKYVTDNVKYPKHTNADIKALMDIHFNIDTTGKITDIDIKKNVSKEVDQAILDVLANAPKFKPGSLNGRNVIVPFVLILDISVDTKNEVIMATRHITLINQPTAARTAPQPSTAPRNTIIILNQTNANQGAVPVSNTENNNIYTSVEVLPEYAGGNKAFKDYVTSHIIYPDYAKKNKLQGRVYLSFVVEKSGELSDLKVLRSPSNDLADEALRVVKAAGKWQPGLQSGALVRVQLTVPIDFNL